MFTPNWGKSAGFDENAAHTIDDGSSSSALNIPLTSSENVALDVPRRPGENTERHRRELVQKPNARILDHATAAAYVGVSERTFDKLRGVYRALDPIEFGRRRVWDIRVLDNWLDEISALNDESQKYTW
jgi:hypothetical protein